jgi:hypothetical protein
VAASLCPLRRGFTLRLAYVQRDQNSIEWRIEAVQFADANANKKFLSRGSNTDTTNGTDPQGLL